MGYYLVTGAAGFIGAAVCRRLLDRGDMVVAVDNMNDYYDVRLKRLRMQALLRHTGERLDFRQLDIECRASVDHLFGGRPFDAVFNLAARAGVRASIDAPHLYFQTNVGGTLNILEAQRRTGVRKHVLASTSSLYAGASPPFVEAKIVDRPISPYAASKRAAELIAYTYHLLHGIDVSVLRYFTVFGPGGRPDMSPFRFIKWIDEGEPVRINGNGEQSRDFTYVDDVAEATIMGAAEVGYEIINIGGGMKPVTLLEMISAIERLLGRRAAVEFSQASPADMAQTQADRTKALHLLGWSPSVEFDVGIQRAVEWHLQNRDLVRDIHVGT